MLSSVLPVTNIDLNRFALSSSNYALSENNLIRKAWAPKLIVLINFFHDMFYLFPECIYLFIYFKSYYILKHNGKKFPWTVHI